jgi:hypothetical protein
MGSAAKERYRDMRKHLIWTLALGAAIAVAVAGIATAAKPTVVRAGNMILTVNGNVSPTALPKNKLAPIKLNVSGSIRTVDGSHPPAAKTITIDFDKNGTTNAKGLPVCKAGQLQARDTTSAKKACPDAKVGSGQTTVRVAFPDQAPFNATGPLVLFNGGVKGGVTTMLIHAYVNVPTPTALVTVVRIKRIHKGKFGTEAVATIPTIAGGSGSVTDFNLTVNRKFTYKGKRQSYLMAKCATGKFYAHGTAQFTDGTRISGDVVRNCTKKG